MVAVVELLRKHEKKQPIEIDLPAFIHKLFPEVRGTKTADIVSQLLVDIYPLCRPHKDGLTRELIVKGSTVKRFLLGDPDGYWDISRIYSQADTSQLQNEAKELVERLAIGPRDIDFRYDLTEGNQDNDIHQALVTSLANQGFIRNDGAFYRNTNGKNYRVVIEQTEIGGINGPPRLFFNILIYVDGKFLLKSDFGRSADLKNISGYNGQRHDDFRVNPYFPGEEIVSYAQVIMNDNKVSLRMKKELVEFFENPWSVKLYHFTTKLPLVLMGKLKGVGFRTFWPELKKKANYDYEKIRQLFFDANYNAPWSDLDYDPNLEKRRMEYISDFLLYLSYDPFLFLRLLTDLNFLPMIPLGLYFSSWDDLFFIMQNMAEEIDHQVNSPDPIIHLAKYSKLYKEKVLKKTSQVKDTGPFMLIRAINKLLEQKGINVRAEESFESLIELFDPNKSAVIKQAATKLQTSYLDHLLRVEAGGVGVAGA